MGIPSSGSPTAHLTLPPPRQHTRNAWLIRSPSWKYHSPASNTPCVAITTHWQHSDEDKASQKNSLAVQNKGGTGAQAKWCSQYQHRHTLQLAQAHAQLRMEADKIYNLIPAQLQVVLHFYISKYQKKSKIKTRFCSVQFHVPWKEGIFQFPMLMEQCTRLAPRGPRLVRQMTGRSARIHNAAYNRRLNNASGLGSLLVGIGLHREWLARPTFAGDVRSARLCLWAHRAGLHFPPNQLNPLPASDD